METPLGLSDLAIDFKRLQIGDRTAHRTAWSIFAQELRTEPFRKSVCAAPRAHASVAPIFRRAADLICTRLGAKAVTLPGTIE